MKIGIVKEIKNEEYRVAVTPQGVKELVNAGHEVLVEKEAGIGSGFPDHAYARVGAKMASTEETWSVELLVKVKEPLESEYRYFNGQMIFTFLHLAGVARSLTQALLKTKMTAIAFETLEDKQGHLPILAPMSAIAGNMATLMGSYHLARMNGGCGMQLGTVLGKCYGKVVVIGDGVVGQHAAKVAGSMGATVYIACKQEKKLRLLREAAQPGMHCFKSSPDQIMLHVADADLVIGAVLVRGAKSPYVISEGMVKKMPNGAVIVDVSIDQGGCVETSRPTSHSAPTFIKHGVVHYCVTNMPGAYPKTSTMALMTAVLPYLLRLANDGLVGFVKEKGLRAAINTHDGYITCKAVTLDFALNEKYRDIAELL